MKHILELNEFFVEGKNRATSHVLLHITEPSTPEEREKGYFFALAEISNAKQEQIEHIQRMIDDLESGYYETDDEEEKNAFEITLEYINRRGHHILEGTKHSDLHAIVGVMTEGNISFAYHGSPTALVWYKNKQGMYQCLSVIHEEEAPGEDQLFSALLQGQIQKNDFFFIASPHVTEYFSEDRLEKIITSRPASQSASHIQKVLTNLRGDESFGGILFHLVTKDQLPKTGKMPAHLKQGSADSLKKLISSQQATNETLNPPMLSRAAGAMSGYLHRKNKKQDPDTQKHKNHTKKQRVQQTKDGAFETNHRSREPLGPQQTLFNMLLVGLGKALVTIGQFLLLILQRILLLLKNMGLLLFAFITNKGGGRQKMMTQVRTSVDQKKRSFEHLPLVSKILFLATILFALMFICSIIFLRVREARDAAAQTYANTVQAIIDKKDAAEASMIYGDDKKAFTLLQEAKQLIDELPNKTEEQQTKITELHSAVEDKLLTLRKIEVVEPTELANINTSHPGALTKKLSLLDGQLIAYGPEDNALYLVNKETGSVDTRLHESIPQLHAASTPKEDDFALFISESDNIAELAPDSFTLSSRDIGFPTSNTSLSALFVYNRRVYTLDQANGQIFKHSATGAGYDQGTPWISQKTSDLADAISLAIDGDIYVLKQHGSIVKFEAGNEVPFSIGGLDPALDSPTELWTYNDVNNIYILEPANKRIVIINKDGVLQKQITAEAWHAPTSMVIDSTNNIAYVLDNNIVYRLSL